MTTKLTSIFALGATLLLLVPALAAPTAAAQAAPAPRIGTSVGDIATLTLAGAAPGHASYWVGDWMADSGWGGFDKAMTSAKAAGVTPVVYWYYWGDSISPSCVEHGCDGRNRAEWLSLTDQLAAHLNATLGGHEVLIVLENEFNKGGITGTYAPTFDTRLEGVAKTLGAVPGAKIVVGFGAWGEEKWAQFPKTIAQSDLVGYQMMRASTKDTESSYRGAANRSVYLSNFIAEKFDKPSFLYDLALSSYPDTRWQTIQAETLDAIFSKLASEGNAGLQGVVYRSANDHYMSPSNYYGYAESHWGLRKSDGTPKPAFDVWLEHSKALAVGSPTAIAPPAILAPAPAPAPFAATFSGLKGNTYWVQVDVDANRPLGSVCATVDGGSCKPLALKSYGYAASFYVPTNAKVVFHATATDGSTATSPTYSWPTATIVNATSTTTTTATTIVKAATTKFTPYDGNTYWVQTKVTSDKTVKSVCASLNGGACTPLSYRSWGAWANDVPAPTGTQVVFKATLSDGTVARSTTYIWPML